MKISLEFKDLRDLLYQMPKFALLIAGDQPYQERMAQAIAPDPEILSIQLTPEDGVPFSPNEKEALRRILLEFVKDPEAFTNDPDTVGERVKQGLIVDGVFPEKAPWAAEAKAQAEAQQPKPAGKPAPDATAPAQAKKKGKATEDTPAPEKPAQDATAPATKVSDADVRAAFNKLMKNDRRDAVVKILKSFGAKNFSGLDAKDYKAAVDAAEAFLAMSASEYKEAIK